MKGIGLPVPYQVPGMSYQWLFFFFQLGDRLPFVPRKCCRCVLSHKAAAVTIYLLLYGPQERVMRFFLDFF